MFDAIVDGNDVQCKTRSRSFFYKQLLNNKPEMHCFEDSVAGVQAANTANMVASNNR
jgi:beta-phosphoglucomutase-like phosphatase (HAD superfamily)